MLSLTTTNSMEIGKDVIKTPSVKNMNIKKSGSKRINGNVNSFNSSIASSTVSVKTKSSLSTASTIQKKSVN